MFIVFLGFQCFGPSNFFAKADRVHENAVFSPFLTQIVSGNLSKIHMFHFSHFWMTTLKILFFEF